MNLENEQILRLTQQSKSDEIYNNTFEKSKFTLGNYYYFPDLILKNKRLQTLYYKCKKIKKIKYEKNTDLLKSKKLKYSVYIFTINNDKDYDKILNYFKIVKTFSKVKFDIYIFKKEQKIYLAEKFYNFIPLKKIFNLYEYDNISKNIFIENKRVIFKIITEAWFYIYCFKREFSNNQIHLTIDDIYLYYENKNYSTLNEFLSSLIVKIDNKNKYFMDLLLRLVLDKNQKYYKDIIDNFNLIINKINESKFINKNNEEVYFGKLILDIFYFDCNKEDFYELLDIISKKEINQLIENDELNMELVTNYDNIQKQNKLIKSLSNIIDNTNDENIKLENKKHDNTISKKNIFYGSRNHSTIKDYMNNSQLYNFHIIKVDNQKEKTYLKNEYLSKDILVLGFLKILFRNKNSENEDLFLTEENKILYFIYNILHEDVKDLNVIANLSLKLKKNLLILLSGIIEDFNIFEIFSTEYLYYFEIHELYTFFINAFSRNLIKNLTKKYYFQWTDNTSIHKLNSLILYLNRIFSSIVNIQTIKIKKLFNDKKLIEFLILISNILYNNKNYAEEINNLYELFSYLYFNINNQKLIFIKKNLVVNKYLKNNFLVLDELFLINKFKAIIDDDNNKSEILKYLRTIPFNLRQNSSHIITILTFNLNKYEKTSFLYHNILKTIINYWELELIIRIGTLKQMCLKIYVENKLSNLEIIDFKNLFNYQFGYYCLNCKNIKLCNHCAFNCHKEHELLPINYEIFECNCLINHINKTIQLPRYLYNFKYINNDFNFIKSDGVNIKKNKIIFLNNQNLNLFYIKEPIQIKLKKLTTLHSFEIKIKELKENNSLTLGFDTNINLRNPLKDDLVIKINIKSKIGNFSELIYDENKIKEVNKLNTFKDNFKKGTIDIDKYLTFNNEENINKSFKIYNNNKNVPIIKKIYIPSISESDTLIFWITSDKKLILMMNYYKICSFNIKINNIFFSIISYNNLKLEYNFNNSNNIKKIFSGKQELYSKKTIKDSLEKNMVNKDILSENKKNYKYYYKIKSKNSIKNSRFKYFFIKNKIKISICLIIFLCVIVFIIVYFSV